MKYIVVENIPYEGYTVVDVCDNEQDAEYLVGALNNTDHVARANDVSYGYFGIDDGYILNKAKAGLSPIVAITDGKGKLKRYSVDFCYPEHAQGSYIMTRPDNELAVFIWASLNDDSIQQAVNKAIEEHFKEIKENGDVE